MSAAQAWDEDAFAAGFFGGDQGAIAQKQRKKPEWDEDAFATEFFGGPSTIAAPEPPAITTAEQNAFTSEMPLAAGAPPLAEQTFGQQLLAGVLPGPQTIALGQALYAGTQDTKRALEAAANIHDPRRLQQLAAEHGSEQPLAQRRFQEDMKRRAAENGDTFSGAASAMWDAARGNPAGAAQMMVGQIPNRMAVGAGMLAGAPLGPPGMWGGYAAATYPLELGNKALERARQGESQDGVLSEAALKTLGLAAVDAATFGASKWLMGAPQRAAERAAAWVLSKQGVDLADDAAVQAALANPAMRAEAIAAKDAALAAATTTPRRSATGVAGFLGETFGEGAGEWAGEKLAGNDPKWIDLLTEAAAGAGLSLGELVAAKEMGDTGKMAKALERAEAMAKVINDFGLQPLGGAPGQSAQGPGGDYAAPFSLGEQTAVTGPSLAGGAPSAQGPAWNYTQGPGWVPPTGGGGAAQEGGPPLWSGFQESVPRKARPYLERIQSVATTHGIPPDLLAAVADQESKWNPGAVSPAGALGLMQFMPGTARRFGIDPNNPEQAIEGAARYLRVLHDEFGNWDLALAGYNAGEGRVRRAGNQIPAIDETRNYVRSVQALRARYGGQPGSESVAGLRTLETAPDAPGEPVLRPRIDFNARTGEIAAYPEPAFVEGAYGDIAGLGDRYLHDLLAQAQDAGVGQGALESWLDGLGGEASFGDTATEIQRLIDEASNAQRRQARRAAAAQSGGVAPVVEPGGAVPAALPAPAATGAQSTLPAAGTGANGAVLRQDQDTAQTQGVAPAPAVPAPPVGAGSTRNLAPAAAPATPEPAPAPQRQALTRVRDIWGKPLDVRSDQLADQSASRLLVFGAKGNPIGSVLRENLAMSDAALMPEARLEGRLRAAGWSIPALQPKSDAGEARLIRRGFRLYEERGGEVVESGQGLVWARPPKGWSSTPQAPQAPLLADDQRIQALWRDEQEEIASRERFATDNDGKPFTAPVTSRPGAMVSVTPSVKSGYAWQVTYWPEGMDNEPSGDMQSGSYAGAVDLVNQYRGDLTAARFDPGGPPTAPWAAQPPQAQAEAPPSGLSGAPGVTPPAAAPSGLSGAGAAPTAVDAKFSSTKSVDASTAPPVETTDPRATGTTPTAEDAAGTEWLAHAEIPPSLKITISREADGRTLTKQVNARKAAELAERRVVALEEALRCLG